MQPCRVTVIMEATAVDFQSDPLGNMLAARRSNSYPDHARERLWQVFTKWASFTAIPLGIYSFAKLLEHQVFGSKSPNSRV